MERDTIQDLVEQGQTLRGMAKTLGCSQGSVRHWLKKYGLRTRRGPKGKIPKDLSLSYKCRCGETDPGKFYGNKRTICGRCQNKYNLKKGQEKRERILHALGGKCCICDFDKYPSALAVHHSNPGMKDPSYNRIRGWSWKRIEQELKHCKLVCRNCHAAVHAGEIAWV